MGGLALVVLWLGLSRENLGVWDKCANAGDGIALVLVCIYVTGLVFRLLPRVMDSAEIIYSWFQWCACIFLPFIHK